MQPLLAQLDAYFSTVNDNAIVNHPQTCTALLKIIKQENIQPLELLIGKDCNTKQKCSLLNILNYQARYYFKDITYSWVEMGKYMLDVLAHPETEVLCFQAVKSHDLAEKIALAVPTFGDDYHSLLCTLLSTVDSARIRSSSMYALTLHLPDRKARPVNNIKALKDLIEKGNSNEQFVALQFLRSHKNIDPGLHSALKSYLQNSPKDQQVFFPDLFVPLLTEQEIRLQAETWKQADTEDAIQALLHWLQNPQTAYLKDLYLANLYDWYIRHPKLRESLWQLSGALGDRSLFDRVYTSKNYDTDTLMRFLAKVKVPETLGLILRSILDIQIMISRGDGGFTEMEALSHYTLEEIDQCTEVKLKHSEREFLVNHCLSFG